MGNAAFRWGFKVQAERIALELRGELGLGTMGRLEPELLAEHLAIPVLTLHGLAGAAPDSVRHFLGRGKGVFSAVTVHVGPFKRVIVTNPAHALTRQMSSLCHELSHVLLEHEAEVPLDIHGGRQWNGVQEREADWLAGCLLIPHDAAHHAARCDRSDDDVAERFGVSRTLATWRMNVTGARLRANRLQRFR